MTEEVCSKCGSKYVLICRTTNNEKVSIFCTQCGHENVLRPDIRYTPTAKLCEKETAEEQGIVKVYA